MTIEPPPLELSAHATTARTPLSIAVQSTYAPYVDGELSTTDLYARDRELGRREVRRYCEALTKTQQFTTVREGAPGQGLHCALSVVSGREPARKGRCLLSLLLTFGLLSHEQREIVRLEAVVTAPGKAPSTYRFEGRITTDAVSHDSVTLRRPDSLSGPENELACALVACMAKDGWLDAVEGSR